MTADGDDLAPQVYADAVETHSAVVYFAGERAYKMKKPVDLGFLDFTSRDGASGGVRARDRAEPAVRARCLPRRQLRCATLPGSPCDHLVVMRRMPASATACPRWSRSACSRGPGRCARWPGSSLRRHASCGRGPRRSARPGQCRDALLRPVGRQPEPGHDR